MKMKMLKLPHNMEEEGKNKQSKKCLESQEEKEADKGKNSKFL